MSECFVYYVRKAGDFPACDTDRLSCLRAADVEFRNSNASHYCGKEKSNVIIVSQRGGQSAAAGEQGNPHDAAAAPNAPSCVHSSTDYTQTAARPRIYNQTALP